MYDVQWSVMRRYSIVIFRNIFLNMLQSSQMHRLTIDNALGQPFSHVL